ncbi:MAG: hypothetical protein K8S16_14905 [Bacteroidales bacterium]|nr:hypothetical protein [Bacteroidales bacterium]
MKTSRNIIISLFLIVILGSFITPKRITSRNMEIMPNPVMNLDFVDQEYYRGDKVTVNIELKSDALDPLYFHEYTWELFENDKQIIKFPNATDENGKAAISFRIPKHLESNIILLKVTTKFEGETETISKFIPMKL